jgi:hypothetical protein
MGLVLLRFPAAVAFLVLECYRQTVVQIGESISRSCATVSGLNRYRVEKLRRAHLHGPPERLPLPNRYQLREVLGWVRS